jgi:hypothetical protein
MYFGSHNSTTQLRLFRWDDASGQINWSDVTVGQWTNGSFTSNAPNGVDWLGRVDGRITGAWTTPGRVGFMWTSGSQAGRPNPFIRVTRIDSTTNTVVDEPDIWSQSNAWAYPAASSNERGDLGVTAFYGGASRVPSHVVGVRDDSAGKWNTVFTRIGSDSPSAAAWGDYLNCRPHTPYGHTWIAAGYTLQGGTARKNVEPRYVHFGFEKDAP